MGMFICKLRKENNMTQMELAQQLHVTDKAVSRWERGIGYPRHSIVTCPI
ncbi:helix-turn-helix domain-containing protein [Holdemanella biformis]